MAEYHTVAQGEYLSMIADQYGLMDYRIIWEDGNNAALKAKRKNPNVLLDGDKVYIPDKQVGSESGATGARHKFQVNTDKLMLRIVLEDIYEKPIANATVTLVIDGQPVQATTDGAGKIEQEIQPNVQQCSLQIGGDQTPFAGDTLSVKVGDLDPEDEITGQCARLNNLGYFAGTTTDPADLAFNSAVQEFQCDNEIKPVTGTMDAASQAKLKSVHGC
jgi:hypothetical protein